MTACAGVAGGTAGFAHKPITSPYTFNEHVLPIVRTHCTGCHRDDGPAPMSLATHADAVPWAESIRMELIAGRMPPSPAAMRGSRLANARALTAQELNVLLTWAAGGTPRGADPEPGADPNVTTEAAGSAQTAGAPDLELRPSDDFVLAPEVQDHVHTYTLRTGLAEDRWVRAVAIVPGAPAVVRSVSVSVGGEGGRSDALAAERLIALWLPGEEPIAAAAGSGFLLPAGAPLTVRVHYRKTWRHERDAIADRTSVGLYFADGPATSIRALAMEPSDDSGRATRVLDRPFSVSAVYVEPVARDVSVSLTAVTPDGARNLLAAFMAHAEWPRRYWLAAPVALPAGARIEATMAADEEEGLLPPGAIRRPASGLGRGQDRIRVVVNGV